MAKKAQKDIESAIVEAAMDLFAQHGYRATRLSDIAAAANCDLGQLRARLDDKTDILALFIKRVDAGVLVEDAGYSEDESPRDRLFDLLMRRFDALQPYRPALQAVSRDLRQDIPSLISLAPRAAGALGWYLEAAGISADGLLGALRLKGLALVWLRSLTVWFEDDSTDLAKTMAALDKALAQAERAAGWFDPGARHSHTRDASDPRPFEANPRFAKRTVGRQG